MNGNIKEFNVLEAPYIKVDATVIQNGITNGRNNIPRDRQYCIAPSAKKIATYIVNQIFGSELVTQSEGLSISWLMPTLKEALELSVYQEESFIYIHKFDDKVYLECVKKNDIFDLVQKYDKVQHAVIKQDFYTDDGTHYELDRIIDLDDGKTYLTFDAYEVGKRDGKLVPININVFNARTGNEYLPKYVLNYECLINIDIGEDFFKDSRKLLIEEMRCINVLADEIQKTRTRIATTEHYQSNDIVTSWKPSSYYQVNTISVGDLQDYFTLLPGDKDHQMFNFLQGEIREQQYVDTFKFYDYQIIQMAGLSPASFGYEKDAYMNTANIDLSKNSSDMTVEAIKTQITPQVNKLFENVVKLQQSQGIEENQLPIELNWDFGSNEKFDDLKKLQMMRSIQGVGSIPYEYKAKIITPILEKLIDDDYDTNNKKKIDDLITAYNNENKDITLDFKEE